MAAVKLIKDLVEKEFPDFLPVTSVADSYNLLDLFFVDRKNSEIRWFSPLQSLFRRRQSSFRLNHVGPLKKSISSKQGNNLQKLMNKAEEKKVVLYDHYQTKSTNIKGDLEIEYLNVDCLSDFESGEVLNLGQITKKNLSYHEIARELKKPRTFSDDLIRLGKKSHLLIIYEILYAERLEIIGAKSSNSSINGGIRMPLSDINQNVPTTSIAASAKKTEIQSSALRRTKEMGIFPIGYKCGAVRIVNQGTRTFLKLSRMDRFHKQFKSTDKRWHRPTSDQFESPPSSMEMEY